MAERHGDGLVDHIRASSSSDSERMGIGVLHQWPRVTAEDDPQVPMESTRMSSMLTASGNSCLLWRTCVMDTEARLPMAATAPDAAAMAVRPSTELMAAAALPPAAHVTAQTDVAEAEVEAVGAEGKAGAVPSARSRRTAMAYAPGTMPMK